MYGGGDSNRSDEAQNNNAAMSSRLGRLATKRRKDAVEEFAQDSHLYNAKRSRHELRDVSPDREEDEEVQEDVDAEEPPIKMSKLSNITGSSAAQNMMKKMGFIEGGGLGKTGQGRIEPVGLSNQRGRHGLGHEASQKLKRDLEETWDDTQEEKTVEEIVEWMEPAQEEHRKYARDNVQHWMKIGMKKMTIEDETQFCSAETLGAMLESKDVFSVLNDKELQEARQRANPYETVGSAFFQNRAAMKTANLDRVFDWIFCGENEARALAKNPMDTTQKGTNVDREKPLFYFADVCAGPGGFSEYMLWRKAYYNAKGFGFTLAGKDDFKLGKFCASSAYYFEPFYGVKKNGDVMDPENIDSLEKHVLKGTNGIGVDLMMADGGFSVEGNENIQEILSKRLYLCQLLVSLCIVKEGGNFFCKLFDIFTPFSVGLIYLMRVCYKQISLHKPHTSRPANSERYIICKGLRKEFSDTIRDYLKQVNLKLDELKTQNAEEDVNEVVPMEVIKEDAHFFNALYQHNEKLADRQTVYLKKYATFAKNQNLLDAQQGDLRDQCMEYWKVPKRSRQKKTDPQSVREANNPHAVLGEYSDKMMGDNDWRTKPPLFSDTIFSNPSEKQLKYAEYRCSLLSKQSPQPALLIATANSVFINKSGDMHQMDRFEYRVPDKTILLVEDEVECFENKEETLIRLPHPKLVRILDAAVLNGDKVFNLSYENRMKAAHKFCDALKLVNDEVLIGEFEDDKQRQGRYNNNKARSQARKITRPCRLVCADVFRIDEIAKIKQNLKHHRITRENVYSIKEHDYHIKVNGIRFTRILPEYACMGYSRSNKTNYAFSKRDYKSIFENDLEKNKMVATFWDSALTTKAEKDKKSMMQAIWHWTASLQTDYGPRAIVEADSHNSGATLSSLQHIVQENDKACGKASAPTTASSPLPL